MPRCRWLDPDPVDQACFDLTDVPLLSEVLWQRGVRDAAGARAFLNPGPDQLGDPYDLPDLDEAVACIRSAVEQRRPIAVFGDYDADGVTSTAILVGALRRLGAEVIPLLPNRLRDGYGLNERAVRQIAGSESSLLIAVDCGTGNAAELALAHQLGLRTVVLDHHHVVNDALPGTAFVSAQRPGAGALRELCGAGVSFQLVRALLGDEAASDYLPLAALATVADVVPLTGANRAIVSLGLKSFDRAPLGLRELARVAGVDSGEVTCRTFGYILGPRINAAGRLADPGIALDLLLTEDLTRARVLGRQLDQLNAERQQQVNMLVLEAERRLESSPDRPLLLLSDPEWHVGLVGLAASKLAERHGRPAVVLAEHNGLSRGSARSVVGFNIVEALDSCGDLLVEHGGHSQAAGLTVRTEMLADLGTRLSRMADEAAGVDGFKTTLQVDAETYPRELTLEIARALAALEPCGHGNQPALLLLRGVHISRPEPTRDGKHLRFRVLGGNGSPIKAIFFNGAAQSSERIGDSPMDLVVRPSVDRWNGREELQVEVVDWRRAEYARPHRHHGGGVGITRRQSDSP